MRPAALKIIYNMNNESSLDLLAIGAHPDDVEIWAGGLMLRMRNQGYQLGILDLTRGEMSTKGTVESRKQEAEQAASMLDARRIQLEFEDGFLTCSRREITEVARIIRKLRPRIVLHHHQEDFHPDHESAGEVAYKACILASRKKFETDQSAWAVQKMISFMAHDSFSPSFVVDVTDVWEQKKELIKCYRSQITHTNSDDRETNLSSDEWFDRFRARHLKFGRSIHAQFGEPYKIDGSVPVPDPVSTFTPDELRDYIPPSS